MQNLHAGDVRRHEVRSELDALKFQVENLRQRFNQKRFGQSGRARNQAMTGGEERDQHLLDGFVLSDDDLPQLGEDALPAFRDSVRADGRGIGGSVHCPSA